VIGTTDFFGHGYFVSNLHVSDRRDAALWTQAQRSWPPAGRALETLLARARGRPTVGIAFRQIAPTTRNTRVASLSIIGLVKDVSRSIPWSLVGGALIGTGIALPVVMDTDSGALLLLFSILLTVAGMYIHLTVGRQHRGRPRTRASR